MPYDKKQYAIQYQKDNIRQIKLALNRLTEADVIQQLEHQPNIRQYIIRLVRKDMDAQKAGD